MPPQTLMMIIVGGDALALSTARELCLVPGHRVVVLWPEDAEFARAVAAVGAAFVAGRPDSRDGLEAAGVAEAVSILALSRDDRTHLQILARLSRLLLRPEFLDELRAAETPADTFQVIEATESELIG